MRFLRQGQSVAIQSTAEQKALFQDTLVSQKTLGALDRLMWLGGAYGSENDGPILHVGVFGKLALTLNRTYPGKYPQDHETDIDIMVIVKTGFCEEARSIIRTEFNDTTTWELEWVRDPTKFYNRRTTGKTTIHVDVHEQHTDYYRRNPLLGHSIFSKYFTLYCAKGQFVSSLLEVPSPLSDIYSRANAALHNKKGFVECREALVQGAIADIDCRRVASIVLRNAYWVITGHRPLLTKNAIKYFRESWDSFSVVDEESVSFGDVEWLLRLESFNYDSNVDRAKAIAVSLIRTCISACAQYTENGKLESVRVIRDPVIRKLANHQLAKVTDAIRSYQDRGIFPISNSIDARDLSFDLIGSANSGDLIVASMNLIDRPFLLESEFTSYFYGIHRKAIEKTPTLEITRILIVNDELRECDHYSAYRKTQEQIGIRILECMPEVYSRYFSGDFLIRASDCGSNSHICLLGDGDPSNPVDSYEVSVTHGEHAEEYYNKALVLMALIRESGE